MRQMEPLTSTAIAAVEWDADDMNPQSIDVTFTNGRVYTHGAVPFTVIQGLVNAPSPGSYYAKQLRGKYGA